MTGKLDEAERYLLLTADANEKLGNHRLTATARSELAHLYRHEDRHDEAVNVYRQTIRSWQEQGHQSAVAHQLECFAYIAITRQEYENAARLLGAAQMARQRLNSPSTDQEEITEKEGALKRLDAEIGAHELERLLNQGELLSLDEAVEFALKEHQGEPG